MMAGYSGWKALERRHAKRMGGERLWRPDFGESAPDGQSAHDVWDCKYTIHTFAIISTFKDCEAKYREWAGDRRFHLCVFGRKNNGPDLVVLRADDYAQLVKQASENV